MISKRSRLLALALLSACVHTTPLTPGDRDALDRVRDAWHAAQLGNPGNCGDLIEVRRHETIESYVDACDGLHPGLFGELARVSAGCTTTALRGVRGVQVAIVHVAPTYHADLGLVQHEALHRLSYCAYDNSDPAHTDARLWEAAGGASSAQARALGPPNRAPVAPARGLNAED